MEIKDMEDDKLYSITYQGGAKVFGTGKYWKRQHEYIERNLLEMEQRLVWGKPEKINLEK